MCAQLLSMSLCNPMDCSSPGSFIHRILQARILEWVAISYQDLPNQELNPCRLCLLNRQVDSLPLSHLGSLCFYYITNAQ